MPPAAQSSASMQVDAAFIVVDHPPMAVRQHVAADLGEELRSLGRDQGARLAQLLWLLGNQRRKIPNDLDTASAYNYALVLAGKAHEARDEALHLHSLLTEETAAPQFLNALAAFLDAGLCPYAKATVDRLRQRSLCAHEAATLRAHAEALAIRFGELAWYRERFEPTPVVAYVVGSDLAVWWPQQQQVLEEAIGDHVAEMTCEHAQDPEHGGWSIALDYYTDAQTSEEVQHLYERAAQGLMNLYKDHPDGPGAHLGRVVVDVHGAEIPVEAVRD